MNDKLNLILGIVSLLGGFSVFFVIFSEKKG
jgi:hypothetical protein